MKKQKLSLILFLSFTLIASSSFAKEKVLLRFNLKKGTVYEMNMDMLTKIDQEVMGNQVKMDQKMDMIISITVDDELPNNNFLITYDYKSFKMAMDGMGQSIILDSDNPDESNPAFAAMKSITDMKLKMEITPLGQVISISGLDEFSKSLAGNPQLSGMLGMFGNEEAFKSNFSQTFNYFPEDKIGTGDSWDASINMPALMNMQIAMNFKVTDISTDFVDLDVNSTVNSSSTLEPNGMKMDISIEGTQNGKMQIDPKDGMMSSSDINQKFSMLMKMKNPQSGEDMEIPMELNSTAKVTVEKK